jgi:ubiquinone/menaquinone biosynthesis C-methylase UbiE
VAHVAGAPQRRLQGVIAVAQQTVQPNAIASSPAELYETFFGPALFAPWAELLVERAAPRPGERVLDLACGTGIVTRRLVPAVGPTGRVVGVDLSPDMLAVARGVPLPDGAAVEWRQADAVDLDLPAASFDLVTCQQGFQFFPDRAAAALQVRRVLVDGGRLVMSAWRGPEEHPLLDASTAAVARHLDVPPHALGTPFSFGDADELVRMLDDAGFAEIEVESLSMGAHFPSARTFMAMTTVAAAAVLPAYAGVVADPASRAALVEAATRATADLLERYRDGDGLTFPWFAHVATGRA